MDYDPDQRLRDLAATAHGQPTDVLVQALNDQQNQALPSYIPLYNRAWEVLVTRYNLERANHLMGHLANPRRDTIYKNTGNLPQ